MEKMQIIWVDRSNTPPSFGIKKHKHPYHHMIYLIRGKLSFVIEDKTYFLSEKQCILIPKNADHAFFNEGNDCGEYLGIKFSFLKSTFETQVLRNNVYVSDSELAGGLFKQIFEEYYTSNNDDKAAVSYLKALLNILTKEERQQVKSQFHYFAAIDYSELSQKIIRYLEEHFHEDVSLDLIAKEMNLNKSYLCVAFKKDTQMTILDCLNTIRIRRAAELVVYSEYSLAQVAEACGFASVSHFNRVFLKYVGITPGQCRRAYPAGTLDFPKNTNVAAFTNSFMYSVLARKLITPQEVERFDSFESE